MTERDHWLRSLAKGDWVLAETMLGFWLRARVRKPWRGSTLEVEYGSPEMDHWLPRFIGLAEGNHGTLPPERVAPLPDQPPTELPSPGPVVVRYGGRRLQSGELVAVEGELGRVLFDEGDDELFRPERVLPRGSADPAAVAELESQGFRVGASVLERGAGDRWNPAWISQVGSGSVYIRFRRASHGRWRRPADLRLGGKLKPPREHLRPSKGPLVPGARVRARWSDRVFYDGRIAKVREKHGRPEAEIYYDDGSRQWEPATRIVVLEAAPPPMPQHDERTPLGRERWAKGTTVLARDRSAVWRPGVVEASAGRDVLVKWKRYADWVGPKDLALPLPDDGHFPAKGTPVVEVPRKGEAHTGRLGLATGGRVEVKRDSGEKVLAERTVLWRRSLPKSVVEAPGFAEVGATVELQVGVDRWAEATVDSHARHGIGVIDPEGRPVLVDPARLRPPPEPPPPPPPPTPPTEPEPPPRPPTPDEEAARLLRLVSLAWARGGYRGGHGSEGTRATLPVDRGELVITIAPIVGGLFRVEMTASTAVEGMPPPDGAMVRLAGWAKGLFGGATPEEERAAADRAWAEATFPRASRVDRAGGALSVTIIDDGAAPPEVVRWCRAVHTRLHGDDDSPSAD